MEAPEPTDCKCWQEGGVETKMTSSDICPNPGGEPDEQWVVYEGYVERCKVCHNRLGEGYGDPYVFATEEEAKKRDDDNKEKMKKGWF